MAIKASSFITLSSIRDLQSCTRYYLLQSSTSAVPAKPTVNPPGGNWVTAEPGYTTGSTNSLYFCDLNIFSDGTFAYSDVSLSSSYEAAKTAYNKAQTAQDTADAAQEDIDNVLKGTLSSSLESSTASCNIAKSFANMHLSAATNGGVAFGSFSSSTNAAPKFENSFPAYFYNNMNISGALGVTGAATFSGAQTVGGNAVFNGGIGTLNMKWQNITLGSGITSPGTWGGGRLRVGKIGTHVYVNGSVNAASGAVLGNIPAGYRPASYYFYSLRPCGGARVARIFVKPDDTLTLEWVRNLSDGKEYTTAVWVDCNFDYFMS